jgi:hypothetical protein
MSVLGTYQGASTIMRKAFDWNLSRISMLEVEAVPQSCEQNPSLSRTLLSYDTDIVTCEVLSQLRNKKITYTFMVVFSFLQVFVNILKCF